MHGIVRAELLLDVQHTGIDAQYSLSRHLSSELLELYALGRVPAPQAAEIEEHLLVCASCLRRLEAVDEFVSAIRRALGTVERVVAVHNTKEGLVYLCVSRAEGGKWVARVFGTELDLGIRCDSAAEAEVQCQCSFTQMFPEHRCTPNCQKG